MKVLVVDDEYFAREGMKRTVDWLSLRCTLCGEAENAIEAIEISKALKPDIIITDINMPGMNGIDMAQSIKVFLPECKFIITTGYDEFEYAKGAIKLSAVDFLLKPVDEKELIEAVIKAREEIKSLKEEKAITREKLLLDSMRGKYFDRTNMISMLNNHGINFEKIIIVNVENDCYRAMMEKGEQEKLYLQSRIMKNIIYKKLPATCYVVECHEDKLAIVIDESFYSKESLEKFLLEIKKEIRIKLAITVTMGVSNINLIEDIKRAYEESKEALSYKLYLGKDKIIYYDEIIKEQGQVNSIIIDEQKDINLLIRARDKRKLENKLRQLYFKTFKENKIEEYVIRQISIEIVLGVISLLKEYNIPLSKIFEKEFDIYKQAAKVNTIDEFYNMVYSFILKAMDAMREVNIEAKETGIEKAVEYIKAHYTENISLNDVAKYAYLSESYLSRKMKKVLGVGFSEYITRLRIEKALKLLKDPKAKVIDVALQVGYPDYRYFSHTFKKYTGYSPSEFIKDKQ